MRLPLSPPQRLEQNIMNEKFIISDFENISKTVRISCTIEAEAGANLKI